MLLRDLLPTVVGCIIAFAGPPLVAFFGKRDAGSLRAMLVGQGMLVGLLIAILLLVMLGEDQTMASLGLGRPTSATFVWGLGSAASFVMVIGPLLLRLPRFIGLAGFDAPLADLKQLPAGYLVLAVVVGGTVEEILYRGFALTRIAALTDSGWTAGTITTLAFAAAHIQRWGWGPALTTAISGAILTVFTLWRQDLWSTILAHVLTDFFGIALGPIIASVRGTGEPG